MQHLLRREETLDTTQLGDLAEQPQRRGRHRLRHGVAQGQIHIGRGEIDRVVGGVDEGLEVLERQITADEVGLSPQQIQGERVLAVVRNDTLRRYFDSTVSTLQAGDRLVIVRRASSGVQQPVISKGDDF